MVAVFLEIDTNANAREPKRRIASCTKCQQKEKRGRKQASTHTSKENVA